MSNFLAIDTATDACTLALQHGDQRRGCHEVIPRQHQQRLFELLDVLLAGARLGDLGLDALVFGRGPGSFTGLRIAASFVQGLAYSLRLPVIGLSTLEIQARSYLRATQLREPCVVASAIDARIGELYCALFDFDGERLTAREGAWVGRPADLPTPPAAAPLHAVGSGFAMLDAMPAAWSAANCVAVDQLPDALDMLPPAERALAAGDTLPPAAALPDYVQERIGWKTLAEQGRKA